MGRRPDGGGDGGWDGGSASGSASGSAGGSNGGMVGADADALAATARGFGRCSMLLRAHRAQLTALYLHAGWEGVDADRSRNHWTSVGSPALLRASEFLEDLGARLLRDADQQRRASAMSPSTSGQGFTGRPHALFGDLVDEVFDDLIDRLFGDHRDVAPTVPLPSSREPAVLIGSRPVRFDAPADGRGAVVAALQGLADEERIGSDEIEIRALDNGRYIVVLPGVTDLSAGIDQFVDRIRERPFGIGDAGRDALDTWSDNDAPTVRKMRYAHEAALRDDTSVNEYSTVTIAALEAARVPSGADVMIVGHSFGAYTAVDLAADPTFNAAHAGNPGDYHVRVTHVVAVGAEIDWRLDELPSGTRALVSNNRFELVYRVEDLLHRDGEPEHPGHLERNFWGGWEGRGHDERNYVDWLAGTGDDDVERWLLDVGARYTSAGTRISARVPDPDM